MMTCSRHLRANAECTQIGTHKEQLHSPECAVVYTVSTVW
ncbi:hypothetical protein GBAR_LOCUS13330, partial [Geodia barretti]